MNTLHELHILHSVCPQGMRTKQVPKWTTRNASEKLETQFKGDQSSLQLNRTASAHRYDLVYLKQALRTCVSNRMSFTSPCVMQCIPSHAATSSKLLADFWEGVSPWEVKTGSWSKNSSSKTGIFAFFHLISLCILLFRWHHAFWNRTVPTIHSEVQSHLNVRNRL